jgi:DNA-binding response OmpR family regulator
MPAPQITHHVTVLVVDDERDLRALTARRLRHAGFTVLEARDGEEAWESALDAAPAALVLDVRMPRLDGLSLTQRIRAHGQLADVAIVLLTASVAEEDEAAGRLAGADVYLRKPCTTDELVNGLRQALSERSARRVAAGNDPA